MASFRVDATVIPVPVLEETEWGASPLLWLFFGSNVVAKNRIGGAKTKSTKVVSHLEGLAGGGGWLLSRHLSVVVSLSTFEIEYQRD